MQIDQEFRTCKFLRILSAIISHTLFEMIHSFRQRCFVGLWSGFFFPDTLFPCLSEALNSWKKMTEVQVPNLPGYIDNDVKVNHSLPFSVFPCVQGTSFNKSHIFDNINGMPVVDKKRGPELCSKPSETVTIPAGTEFHAWSKDLGQPDMSETTKRLASSLNGE